MKEFNILLVSPRWRSNENEGKAFPLGLPSISSPMKLIGLNVYTLNLDLYSESIETILSKYINKHNISAVATTGFCTDYVFVNDILSIVKSLNKNITTIVGGCIISGDPVTAMQAFDNADFGVIGEGEITICELSLYLEKLNTGYSRILEFNSELAANVMGGNEICKFHQLIKHIDIISEIKGIIYRDEDGLHTTPKRKAIESLDVLPWIDYDGFGFAEYLARQSSKMFYDPTEHFNHRSLPITSSRSCPNNCTFCFHSLGRIYRERDINDFINHIEYMINHYEIEFISIADDLFTYRIERVKAFCIAMEKYDIKWSIYIRVTFVNEELAKLLSNSNCEGVYLGIESASNDILKSMKKNITIEQTEHALKILYEHNIRTLGNIIIGDVEETFETAKASLHWAKEMNQRYNLLHLAATFLIAYPGCEIYKQACEKGFITKPVEFFKKGIPQINVSKMNNDEFIKISNMISDCNFNSHQIADCELSSLDKNTLEIDINATCPSCRASNDLYSCSQALFNFLKPISCSNCGSYFTLSLPAEIQHNIIQNISQLIDNANKIAFWGGNNKIYDLVREHELLRRKGVYYVDGYYSNQGTEICTETIVMNPLVITEEKIEIVIILVLRYTAKIEEIIANHYPSVKKVIPVNYLMFKDYMPFK